MRSSSAAPLSIRLTNMANRRIWSRESRVLLKNWSGLSNRILMVNHAQTKLAASYRSRAGLFLQKVRASQFREWQKRAQRAAWENLVWNWNELGISKEAREAAEILEFLPSEVFAHPEVVLAQPELTDYYRLVACLTRKSLSKYLLSPGNGVDLCRRLNGALSVLLVRAAKNSHEISLNPIIAQAAAQWERFSAASVEMRLRQDFECILVRRAFEEGLDEKATEKLREKQQGMVLESGVVLRFRPQPDIEFLSKKRDLLCAIEINASTDKADAQTRLGEAKKSFALAKLQYPRCRTIFISSVLTPAIERQLKTERDIDQRFDLLAILKDEAIRTAFLTELFKFCLRKDI